MPETADLVMYWWNVAAGEARASCIRRFGLITTNSITQTFNRSVLQAHLEADAALSLVFAIPDHPWVDSATGAAVRIAMTVGQAGSAVGSLQDVVQETEGDDGVVEVGLNATIGRIHSDLKVGADVAGVAKLRTNAGLSFMGVTLCGDGFIVAPLEATNAASSAIRDLVARTREAWTIESVCAAFKGAKKTDVEDVLESLEALGLLTGYTHHSTRRWKSVSG